MPHSARAHFLLVDGHGFLDAPLRRDELLRGRARGGRARRLRTTDVTRGTTYQPQPSPRQRVGRIVSRVRVPKLRT